MSIRVSHSSCLVRAAAVAMPGRHQRQLSAHFVLATLDAGGELVESVSSEEGADVELVHRYNRGPAVLFAVARTIDRYNRRDGAAELIRQVRTNVEAGVFRGGRDLPNRGDGRPILWGTMAEENDLTFICRAGGNGVESPCPVNPAGTLREGLSMAIVNWPDLITSLEPAVEAFVTHEANPRFLAQGGCCQSNHRVTVNPLAFGDTVAFATNNGTRGCAASRVARALRGETPLKTICRDQARRQVEDRPGETAIISLIQFTRFSGESDD